MRAEFFQPILFQNLLQTQNQLARFFMHTEDCSSKRLQILKQSDPRLSDLEFVKEHLGIDILVPVVPVKRSKSRKSRNFRQQSNFKIIDLPWKIYSQEQGLSKDNILVFRLYLVFIYGPLRNIFREYRVYNPNGIQPKLNITQNQEENGI